MALADPPREDTKVRVLCISSLFPSTFSLVERFFPTRSSPLSPSLLTLSSQSVIAELKRLGIRVIMLTGDSVVIAKRVAEDVRFPYLLAHFLKSYPNLKRWVLVRT